MKNVFDVKIHYHGGTKEVVTVVSSNDVQARAAAIRIDAKALKENLETQPKIDFCEIELVADKANIA